MRPTGRNQIKIMLRSLREFDALRLECVDATPPEEPEEGTDRNEVVVDDFVLERLRAAVSPLSRLLPVEP